ncbi:MAG: hypothetical protein CMQ40_10080 [Gammaproteobacteria bacterium]|nr:hypothetical protein [Gammaproteobacteria bacterium]|tara:strand:+ start:790 stop:1143 length:354 start_codon:yes stop_codon:yes gene_type:complete
MNDLPLQTESRLISCILPKGQGMPLQKALAEEKEIFSANLHHGRGVGKGFHLNERSVGDQQEREILEVVVPFPIADEIFDFIYYKAKINEPHGGIVYVSKIARSSSFELPDIDWEKE